MFRTKLEKIEMFGTFRDVPNKIKKLGTLLINQSNKIKFGTFFVFSEQIQKVPNKKKVPNKTKKFGTNTSKTYLINAFRMKIAGWTGILTYAFGNVDRINGGVHRRTINTI